MDADLMRSSECLTDMAESRELGFIDYKPSDQTLFDLFDRLQRSGYSSEWLLVDGRSGTIGSSCAPGTASDCASAVLQVATRLSPAGERDRQRAVWPSATCVQSQHHMPNNAQIHSETFNKIITYQ